MPTDDPIDDSTIAKIDWLAREVFGDEYTGEAFLSERIIPIYKRSLYELNMGQARMVLDDLRHTAGEGPRIDWPSIAGDSSGTERER